MVVLGLGMGFLMQTTMLIAQNSVEQKDLGVGSSAATFFRSIGGSFGVALFGAIFVHQLAKSPAGAALSGSGGGGVDPTALHNLPAQIRDAVMGGLADSIANVFVWAAVIVILVPILSWFVKEIPLRGAADQPGGDKETPADEAEVALAKAEAISD